MCTQGQADTGAAAAIAAGHQPVGTHTAGLALGAVLWEDRPCQWMTWASEGPRDSGDTYAVHVQGMAALLTGGPAGPGVALRQSDVEHGWGRLGREGRSGSLPPPKLAASREELRAEIPPHPAHSQLTWVWAVASDAGQLYLVQELQETAWSESPQPPHARHSAGSLPDGAKLRAVTPVGDRGALQVAGAAGEPAHTRRRRPGKGAVGAGAAIHGDEADAAGGVLVAPGFGRWAGTC